AYLAGLVAASNAGGAGSVVGDTTTTMIWIAGKSPLDVIHGYVGALIAGVICAVFAARTQEAYQPMAKRAGGAGVKADWTRLGIVFFILIAAIVANVATSLIDPELGNRIPVIGLAVWAAILVSAVVRPTEWYALPGTLKGTVFLLALVLCASLMPVKA